jgi:hypothetical protein
MVREWVRIRPTPCRAAIAKSIGTEQEFSSSFERLGCDTAGLVDPDVSFEAHF